MKIEKASEVRQLECEARLADFLAVWSRTGPFTSPGLKFPDL